jgi:hypothetical protein
MTNIYIWNSDSKQYDTCYLLDWNSKNTGKALAEIEYEQQKERLAGKQLKATAIEAKVNLNAEIDSIVAEAKQISKSAPIKSKNERVTNIRENRANERIKMQNGEASESEIPAIALQQSKPEEELSPRLRMIKAKAEEKLKNGASIAIFPEGSRTRTGNMGVFKKGAYQMALDLKLPIVPITINGSYNVMPTNSYLINPCRMEMIIHDPIHLDKVPPGNLREVAVKVRELVDQSRSIIASSLWEGYR